MPECPAVYILSCLKTCWVQPGVLACVMTACVTLPPAEVLTDQRQLHADRWCNNLPSVEECQGSAEAIQNSCLRQCVTNQCEKALVRCNQLTAQVCREYDANRTSDGKVLGFSSIGSRSEPVRLIAWCCRQFKNPARNTFCRKEALVHELAHSCGFRHDGNPLRKDGETHDPGVPGHEGTLANYEVQ